MTYCPMFAENYDSIPDGRESSDITIEEHTSGLIENFDEKDWDYLDKKCWKKKKDLIAIPLIISRNRDSEVIISNTSYAGAIRLKNVRIILSTKFKTNLFHMLSYLKSDEKLLYDPDRIIQIEEGGNFFDFIARLFLIELEKIIDKGLLKRYVRNHENIGYIKGKLSIKGQIKNEIRQMPKFSCIYDDLTFNNLENKTVLNALSILIPKVVNKSLRKDLKNYEYIIRDFVDIVNISPNDCDRIQFNRLNDYYNIIIKISKMILEDNYIISTKKGRSRIFNFLIDMDYVYENFIIEMIKEVVEKDPDFIHFKAKRKPSFCDLVKENKNENKICVQPDLALQDSLKDSEYYTIIDAKYEKKDSNNDYYEIISYCLSVPGVSSGCLIFPNTEKVENEEFILSRLDQITLFIRKIDLFMEDDLDFEHFIEKIQTRIKEILTDCSKIKQEKIENIEIQKKIENIETIINIEHDVSKKKGNNNVRCFTFGDDEECHSYDTLADLLVKVTEFMLNIHKNEFRKKILTITGFYVDGHGGAWQPKPIADTDIRAETKSGGFNDIVNKCYIIIETFGHNRDELKIYR